MPHRIDVVELPRDRQVELRIEPEHEADNEGDGERDEEAGAVHAVVRG